MSTPETPELSPPDAAALAQRTATLVVDVREIHEYMSRHIEGKHQQLQKDLAELKRVEEEVPRVKASMQEIEDQLGGESYGVEIRGRLQELTDKLKAIDYDRVRHQEIKRKLGELVPSSEMYRELTRAKTEHPQLQDALRSTTEALDGKRQQADRLSADMLSWKGDIAGMAEVESELAEIASVLAECRSKREDLASEKAVAEARRDETGKQIAELSDRKEELDHTRSAMDDFVYLAEAFGKKGIQAVIIENAVPEIEAEANRILGRLSENQMHVALATQARTKAGATIETLDLLIGDELGTRNYELYSGGESFKVDFAVRVALSRLLARRAGAKLETLIIDEGFGSQDEQSRERMVRAINSIRPDFSRILVITHISEVREMFPTQILVSKVNGTSRVQLTA